MTPDYTCNQSAIIFEEHKQLAQEYLKVQTELALLNQHKNQLSQNLRVDNFKQEQDIVKLKEEKVCRLFVINS